MCLRLAFEASKQNLKVEKSMGITKNCTANADVGLQIYVILDNY